MSLSMSNTTQPLIKVRNWKLVSDPLTKEQQESLLQTLNNEVYLSWLSQEELKLMAELEDKK